MFFLGRAFVSSSFGVFGDSDNIHLGDSDKTHKKEYINIMVEFLYSMYGKR